MTIEEEAQDVLARVVDCEEPPLGFTADDIVARGRRQVRARKNWRAAGGAASVIAVIAAVLPVARFDARGTSPSPGHPPDLAKLAQADPHCYAEVVAMLKPADEDLKQPLSRLSVQLCPMFRRIHGDLNPEGGSFNTDDTDAPPPFHTDLINYTTPGSSPYVGVVNQVYWTTASGFSYNPSGNHTTRRPVLIEVAVQAPGLGPQYRQNRLDHRQVKPPENSTTDPVPWGPATITTLSDGTTVSVHQEQDDTGESIEAVRTLKSGVQIFVYIDGSAYGSSQAKEFPFTEQQTVTAISVPITEDIHLPA